MPLTIEQARRLGEAKLRIDRDIFDFAANVADEMEISGDARGPMILAIAILKLSRVDIRSEALQSEMTDALALVDKAEKQWRLEQMGWRQ